MSVILKGVLQSVGSFKPQIKTFQSGERLSEGPIGFVAGPVPPQAPPPTSNNNHNVHYNNKILPILTLLFSFIRQ